MSRASRYAAEAPAHLPAVEYVGSTALTVFGAGTGARYRFAHTGARLAVQAPDLASMLAVPGLRRA